jgi:AcrR family transcriptional regulator
MRLLLVEAAAELLAEHGRDAVTARRLASAVGASTQVVYTYFDGIDDVLAEVWREGFRRFGLALDEPATTADPVADWMVQGWGYRRFATGNPHLYRVMFADGLLAMRLGKEEDVLAAQGTFLSLLARIERCRDVGRWVVDDVWTAGEVIWSLCHGFASIELHGYYRGIGRDPRATFGECLRRTALGYQDDPAAVERSLTAARRRARRADAAAGGQN